MLVSPYLFDYALLEPGDRIRRVRGRTTGSRVRRAASRKPRV
jgi:hypothetical protein